jgi:thioredoxin 1
MTKTQRKGCIFIGVMAACLAAVAASAGDSKNDAIPPVPTPGLVTMLDLGAHKCIPCKMMAPIIAELREEYKGRASIIFIDVWEHREQARRFGIRSIPTQIFYDRKGKEVGRHIGFLDKKSIVETLVKLGVPKEGGQ